MKKIIFAIFMFSLIILVSTEVRCDTKNINNYMKSKLKEHVGIFMGSQNGIILVYELTYRKSMKYKLDKNFVVILNSKDMPDENNSPIEGNIRILKTGYKIKFLVDQKDGKVKRIFIEEIPR